MDTDRRGEKTHEIECRLIVAVVAATQNVLCVSDISVQLPEWITQDVVKQLHNYVSIAIAELFLDLETRGVTAKLIKLLLMM